MIFGVIERIEISLRTKLIYHLSHEYDPWWFQDTSLFQNIPALIKTLESLIDQVKQSKEKFMQDHRSKYSKDKRFPPAWKTLELTSFGALSKLYGNLKNQVKSKDIIAEELGAVNHTYLPSWLQSITQIRNFCAHHSRLWNKNLPGKCKLLKDPPYKWINDVPSEGEFHYLYIHLCIMKYLLDRIDPNNNFSSNLKALIDKYESSVDPKALGLKQNWRNEPLWKA